MDGIGKLVVIGCAWTGAVGDKGRTVRSLTRTNGGSLPAEPASVSPGIVTLAQRRRSRRCSQLASSLQPPVIQHYDMCV